MKKILLLFVAVMLSMQYTNAQSEEFGPVGTESRDANALFDLLFTHDVGANGAIGANGQAGMIYFNGEYWISAWASNLIHVLDVNGNYMDTFSIPGITGTRAMTTDGTNIYIGTAALTIYVVDHATRTLTGTINVSASTITRMLTYDETLDGGNGGFWIGDFDNNIASIDMNGNELSVIPGATHGTVVYGGAIDNVSPGGPFLWIHDQTGAIPSRDLIVQLDPATGMATGVVYDYTLDGMGAGATEVLAGGIFISDDVEPGYITMIGLCQCSPSNLVFGLELIETLNVESNSNEISDFKLHPNPVKGDFVSIETQISGEKQIQVYDNFGRLLIDTAILDKELNISALTTGLYTVKVIQSGISATKKLIVR